MATRKKPAVPKRGRGQPKMIGNDTWAAAETWTAQQRRERRTSKAGVSKAQRLVEALAVAKKTVKAPRVIAAYDLLEYVFSRGILPLSRQRAAVKGLVPWLIEQLPATARNERKELRAARDAYLTGGPSREDA